MHDWDRTLGQQIGEAALLHGANGFIVSSASRLGSNVIVLPDNNTATTRLVVTSWRGLRYVLRYH